MKKNFALIAAALLFNAGSAFANDNLQQNGIEIPTVKFNSGLLFQSERAGTPNSFSGYIFAPLLQGENGQVLFLDGFGTWNIGGEIDESTFGFSSRLGYRWLDDTKKWMFGVNAGVDTTSFDNDYHWQAGLGLEALSERIELRANAYIPLSDNSEKIDAGFDGGAYLKDSNIYLKDAYEDWHTSLGGFDVEAGVPLATWEKGSFWLYGGYYYLQTVVDNSTNSHGFKARAEAKLSDQFSIGAIYSYDDIFDSKVSGYLRYGTTPVSRNFEGEIARAEKELLVQRGLPVQREIDVRIGEVRVEKGDQKAKNPKTNKPWIVRCVGSNKSRNSCDYNTMTAAIDAGESDVILVANGKTTDLEGGSLLIPKSTVLSNGRNAPKLDTQFGTTNLRNIYGRGNKNSLPVISNGTIALGSDTTIAGFDLNNATITNSPGKSKNINIRNNTFTGSVNGEGAIVLDGSNDVVVAGNTIINPTTSALEGDANGSLIGRGIAVKNVDNILITGNIVKGATGEGIYIENIGTNRSNMVSNNTVSGMRVNIDTNLEAGIFVRNNKDGYIAITGNTVKDNNLTSGEGFPADRGTNSSDGIEVNICRGGENLGSDAFTDGVAGSCDENATLTAVIYKNTVDNLHGGADGIDANIGDNGRLNLTVDQNIVTGVGDEGFTLDAFGANTRADVVITNNILKTSGAKGAAPGEDGSTDGIAITLQENVSDTDFIGSGVYNFVITGNTIEADTDNLAGTNERGDKAEGIKFTINEGLKVGTTKVTALIENNDIKTRIGDGIEFAVNEKAGDGVVFEADITINNNRIIQTNNNPSGPDNKDPRDLIKATFGEEAEGSITVGTFTITNNILTSADGAGDAINYESLSTSNDNAFKFKIEGNDFTSAANKSLKIAVPAGSLGFFAPDGTTDFENYLNKMNPGAEAEITGNPTSVATNVVTRDIIDLNIMQTPTSNGAYIKIDPIKFSNTNNQAPEAISTHGSVELIDPNKIKDAEKHPNNVSNILETNISRQKEVYLF